MTEPRARELFFTVLGAAMQLGGAPDGSRGTTVYLLGRMMERAGLTNDVRDAFFTYLVYTELRRGGFAEWVCQEFDLAIAMYLVPATDWPSRDQMLEAIPSMILAEYGRATRASKQRLRSCLVNWGTRMAPGSPAGLAILQTIAQEISLGVRGFDRYLSSIFANVNDIEVLPYLRSTGLIDAIAILAARNDIYSETAAGILGTLGSDGKMYVSSIFSGLINNVDHSVRAHIDALVELSRGDQELINSLCRSAREELAVEGRDDAAYGALRGLLFALAPSETFP